jgi:hypothetical protein
LVARVDSIKRRFVEAHKVSTLEPHINEVEGALPDLHLLHCAERLAVGVVHQPLAASVQPPVSAGRLFGSSLNIKGGGGGGAAPCEHFGQCGGCTFQNLAYEHQLRHKQVRLSTPETTHENVPPKASRNQRQSLSLSHEGYIG